MKKFLCILLLLTFPARALAQNKDFVQPPIITMPLGDDQIKGVKKGDPAPFEGQVFSTDTAMRWGFWLKQYQERFKLDVETQRQLDAVQLHFVQEQLRIEKERAEKNEETWRTENEELRNAPPREADHPWYNTFVFGAVTGVVLTGALVAVTAYGLNATN